MTGPHPAVARTRSAVRAALARLREPDGAPVGPVLVACSGGPDSLALAAATAFVAPRTGFAAGAVVVDHGWFPGSAEVAGRAAEQCRVLGLDPVLVERVRPHPSTPSGPPVPRDTPLADPPSGSANGVSRQTGGPEAAARTARYRLLDDAADRLGAPAVLLGHTRDDQAETVLLGLLRGSGARALAGMRAVRGRYRRPFLDLPATDTAQACAALGLDPWRDPANADPAYARSRLRAVLTDFAPALHEALGGDVRAALARTASQLADDADLLDASAADLLAAARTTPDGGGPGVALDAATLAAAPRALRTRALLQAARDAGSPAGSLGSRHVAALEALVTRWHGQGPVHLPGGVVASRRCGTLLLHGHDPYGDDQLGERGPSRGVGE